MVQQNSSVSNAELAVEKNNEGVSRFKAGDLAGAARSFQAALQFDPALGEARENRDMAVKRLGYDPMVETRRAPVRRSKDFEIDSGGELLEKLIQYGMYTLAGVIAVAILVGMFGILGPTGIIILVVGALVVWAIKWGWLFFIK